jgi:murein DD-endopeptidase MepM/ murein hydrolase activator NlpD
MKNELFINPVIARVTSVYGKRKAPKTGASTYHSGVDLATPLQTAIKCPANGIVGDKGFDSLNGNYIKIIHDNGYITGYAHLSSIPVPEEKIVIQGEIIGFTGKSGITTGPCLHFTLRKGKNLQGATIDPLPYFDFKTVMDATLEGTPIPDYLLRP